MRKTLRERFEEKVSPEPNTGCWLWTGPVNNDGYGFLKIDRANRKAHRVAWELARGIIPPHACVCHRCDRPSCVNPAHLFVGTQVDNMRDRTIKKRTNKPHGSKNGRAKLTDGDVAIIRTRHALGESLTTITRAFGIGKSQMSEICRGKSWVTVDALVVPG